MIQVTFPVPQQYIKVELEKVRNEIKAKWAELKVLQAMAKAIQDQCSHPETFTAGYYDGSTDMNCKVCGKSW